MAKKSQILLDENLLFLRGSGIPFKHLSIILDGRSEMWLPFFFGSWLKLDTWPCSSILDLPFIARSPRPVLPTSFAGDVTSKLTGDEWRRGCHFTFQGKKSPSRLKNMINLLPYVTYLLPEAHEYFEPLKKPFGCPGR